MGGSEGLDVEANPVRSSDDREKFGWFEDRDQAVNDGGFRRFG